MKKSKSLLLMIALVLVIGTVLAGCGGNNANNGKNASPTNAPADNAGNKNTGNATGDEKLAADQTLKINLSSEPPTFDPQQAQDSTSNAILKLLYEGLTRQNAETGQAEEGIAESWEISLTARYILSNSVMQNGATANL